MVTIQEQTMEGDVNDLGELRLLMVNGTSDEVRGIEQQEEQFQQKKADRTACAVGSRYQRVFVKDG